MGGGGGEERCSQFVTSCVNVMLTHKWDVELKEEGMVIWRGRRMGEEERERRTEGERRRRR